jgi:hypothetical protein
MNTTKAKLSANPIHIMLLGAALYIPSQFANPMADPLDFQLPCRSSFCILLGPAVGIIVSTFISAVLVIGEPLYRALLTTREAGLAEIVARKRAKMIQELVDKQYIAFLIVHFFFLNL